MAKITINEKVTKAAFVVLKGPQEERIITGTNLPGVKLTKAVNDQDVAIWPLLETARVAASQRPGWGVEVWNLTVFKKDGRIKSFKIKTENGDLWVGGWPSLTNPSNGEPARFSTNLIQKQLAANGLDSITRDTSEKIEKEDIERILSEVNKC